MPLYEFRCSECGVDQDIFKTIDARNDIEICDNCAGLLQRKISNVTITGTRDSFGIGKEFKDEQTGKVIDNWKSWEKAGYSDPMDSPSLNSSVKAGIKRKADKIEKYDTKKRLSVS